MQKRKNLIRSRIIIPPTQAISLSDGPCKCVASEAWSDQHRVFFAEKATFLNFTISRDMRTGGQLPCEHVSDWVFESAPETFTGCCRLQIMRGDFRVGYLLIESGDDGSDILQELLVQLITSQFIIQRLDTLTIIPMNQGTMAAMEVATDLPTRPVMTFSRNLLLIPEKVGVITLERDHWLSSPPGERSLERLSWLKRRVERENKIANPEPKPARVSWLASILSLGLRRPRQAPTVHPLDSFRQRN
jgi:hypothetical protein